MERNKIIIVTVYYSVLVLTLGGLCVGLFAGAHVGWQNPLELSSLVKIMFLAPLIGGSVGLLLGFPVGFFLGLIRWVRHPKTEWKYKLFCLVLSALGGSILGYFLWRWGDTGPLGLLWGLSAGVLLGWFLFIIQMKITTQENGIPPPVHGSW